MRAQSQYLALRFDQFDALLFVLVAMTALTICTNYELTLKSGCNLGNGISPLDDLVNCFFLEFRGVALSAHAFLLCSNHRSEMSTGVRQSIKVIC